MCDSTRDGAATDHPLPPRDAFWPFLHCAFTHGEKQTPTVAQKCAGLASMDWDKIEACYEGSQGYNLELMYAKDTNSLDPPHTYVPWVTLNGKVCLATESWAGGGEHVAASPHLPLPSRPLLSTPLPSPPLLFPPYPSLQHDVEAEGPKLTKEICDAYTGTRKPPACHSSYWL